MMNQRSERLEIMHPKSGKWPRYTAGEAYTEQLWKIMRNLGEYFETGFNSPFMDIEIKAKDVH